MGHEFPWLLKSKPWQNTTIYLPNNFLKSLIAYDYDHIQTSIDLLFT